jgi:hypothetical protein
MQDFDGSISVDNYFRAQNTKLTEYNTQVGLNTEPLRRPCGVFINTLTEQQSKLKGKNKLSFGNLRSPNLLLIIDLQNTLNISVLIKIE